MLILSNSLVYRFLRNLFQVLTAAWTQSKFYDLCRSAANCCSKALRGSWFVRVVCRQDGAFTRAWPNSVFHRVIHRLLNLPAELLHALFTRSKPLWDNSIFMRLAFFLGENIPVLLSWLLLCFMITPYELWNNGYPLVSGVLLFFFIIAAGMRRASLRMDLLSIGPYIPLYFLAVILACPLSLYPSLSLRYILYFAPCAICVLIVASTTDRLEALERLAGFSCLGMLGASAYGILQRLQGLEVNNLLVDITLNPNMPGRVYSFYQNPNSFALLLVLFIPIAAGLFLGAQNTLWRIVGLISGLVGALTLVMTYSRACWGGLLLAAFLFVLLWNRKLLPVLFIVCLAAIPLLPEPILTRILTIFSSKDTSILTRFPLYEAAVEVISLRPLAGAGLGTDAVRRAINELIDFKGMSTFVHTHNTFLQIWLETGLLGFLSFLAAMFHAIKQGIRTSAITGAPQSARLLIFGCISGLCGSLLSGMVDYIWTFPRIMFLFWVVVALLTAAIKLTSSATQNKTER